MVGQDKNKMRLYLPKLTYPAGSIQVDKRRGGCSPLRCLSHYLLIPLGIHLVSHQQGVTYITLFANLDSELPFHVIIDG